jgi:translation elongation factor EF-G
MFILHFLIVGYIFSQIQTPIDCVSAIYVVLSKRRGHVTADVPKPGTPIYIVKVRLTNYISEMSVINPTDL